MTYKYKNRLCEKDQFDSEICLTMKIFIILEITYLRGARGLLNGNMIAMNCMQSKVPHEASLNMHLTYSGFA